MSNEFSTCLPRGGSVFISVTEVSTMRLQHWLYKLPLRIRSLFQRRAVEQELDEEIRYHTERQTNEYSAAGMPPEEARYAAMHAFAGIDQRKEECRDVRGVNILEHALRDLKYAGRMVRKNLAFSMSAILTLGLGIGACTAIFTLVNGVLLRPLPYSDPDSLVQIFELSEKGNRMNVPEANFVDWKQGSRSFEDMAIFNAAAGPILGGGEPVRALAAEVSDGFFEMMRVRPARGR